MLGITLVYVAAWGLVLYCFVLKLYLERSRGKFDSKVRLDGKVALVTGATQGIGLEVARDLLRRGCRVWMACRDLKRGKVVAQQLIDSVENEKEPTAGQNGFVPNGIDKENTQLFCRPLFMDLCSLRSVREAVEVISAHENHLDILINNAAIIAETLNTFSEDGFEATFQTNFLSPIYLTILLIDLLRRSPSARVVNVSSNLHHVGLLSASVRENATREASWWESPLQLYANSKFALNMASLELGFLLREESITVNTVHPGATRTRISFHGSTSMAVFFFFIYQLFGKTPEEAAETISFAAVCPSLDGITGRHLVDCGPGWNNWRVFNSSRRKRILDETCHLLQLPSLYK